MLQNNITFKFKSTKWRFDQVSEDIDNKKVDPTLRKYENPGATVIQMLLAAKEGDVGFLRRWCKNKNSVFYSKLNKLFIWNIIHDSNTLIQVVVSRSRFESKWLWWKNSFTSCSCGRATWMCKILIEASRRLSEASWQVEIVWVEIFWNRAVKWSYL